MLLTVALKKKANYYIHLLCDDFVSHFINFEKHVSTGHSQQYWLITALICNAFLFAMIAGKRALVIYLRVGVVSRSRRGSSTSWLIFISISIRVVSERKMTIFCVRATAASRLASLRVLRRCEEGEETWVGGWGCYRGLIRLSIYTSPSHFHIDTYLTCSFVSYCF